MALDKSLLWLLYLLYFVPLFCLCGQYLSSFHKEFGRAYKNVSIKIHLPVSLDEADPSVSKSEQGGRELCSYLGGGQGSLTRKEVTAAASPTFNQRTPWTSLNFPRAILSRTVLPGKPGAIPQFLKCLFCGLCCLSPAASRNLASSAGANTVPIHILEPHCYNFWRLLQLPLDSDHHLASHSFSLQSNPSKQICPLLIFFRWRNRATEVPSGSLDDRE